MAQISEQAIIADATWAETEPPQYRQRGYSTCHSPNRKALVSNTRWGWLSAIGLVASFKSPACREPFKSPACRATFDRLRYFFANCGQIQ